MKCRESKGLRAFRPATFSSARVAIGILVLGSSMALLGQSESQGNDPASIAAVFASISIKLDNSGMRSYGTRASANEFSARNETAQMLIQLAYGVDGSTVVGLPKWGEQDHFDVQAVVDQSIAQQIGQLDDGANPEVSQRLIRGVLEKAFGLIAHRETLDVPVYELRTINDGPRCLNMAVAEPYSGSRTLVSTKHSITGPYITMPSLAMLLSGELGADVLDRTGLGGGYRIDLQWALNTHKPAGHSNSDLSATPSILEALKQQLGLTLWKGQAPREVLVVDRLERPKTD